MAGVDSRFAEVTENDILWMQDITIPNDTKKATKLGVKVFRDPDRQAPRMPLSLNNNSPSKAPFQSPIQVNSTSFEQNVSKKIWTSLSPLK